jgi:hypothetical protein
MSRTPARVTQADVARCVRAARQAGAGMVEVRPDGTVLIHISAPAGAPLVTSDPEKEVEYDDGIVL